MNNARDKEVQQVLPGFGINLSDETNPNEGPRNELGNIVVQGLPLRNGANDRLPGVLLRDSSSETPGQGTRRTRGGIKSGVEVMIPLDT